MRPGTIFVLIATWLPPSMEKRPLPPGFQARKIQPLELPRPSAYRDLMRPDILATPPVSDQARWFERKRVVVGIAIAAAFHISIGLALWLTPPLRLKVGYAPDRWVQVVSVAPHEDVPRAAPAHEKLTHAEPASGKLHATHAAPATPAPGSSRPPT